MATLKLYLTSLEPEMTQTIYSQSIGGYISNSFVYPETTLSSTIGLYDTSISLDTPISGSWSEWQGIEYINIGNEMIKVSPIVNGSITVLQRGYNDIVNMHIANDIVREVSFKDLFNDVFNSSRKQYRCIALKNISSSPSNPSNELIAYDISVYLKQNSRSSDSTIKIALEMPQSQYLSSVSTEWNSMQIIDASLAGIYSDNHYVNAYLKIDSGDAVGQGKIIRSFDSVTGTFTLASSFSSLYDYSGNVSYTVFPSPAQRIKTGTESPIFSTTNVTPLIETSENLSLKFLGEGSNFNIEDLKPNDIIYIWLEREVMKGVSNFDNNDCVLNFKYKVIG